MQAYVRRLRASALTSPRMKALILGYALMICAGITSASFAVWLSAWAACAIVRNAFQGRRSAAGRSETLDSVLGLPSRGGGEFRAWAQKEVAR